MKENLVEIKKGQTGTGLLIENDGFVSLDYDTNKVIKEDIQANGTKSIPNPFIVSAVFQKFGIENANGRIYPEDILKREVEKYQEAIRERRAYGECYTPDVLCLTVEGWKPLSEVKEGDMVQTLNVETNEIEAKKVVRKIEREHNGKMIRIQGRHFNDLVTPEHKFPLFNRNGKFESYVAASDIFEDNSNKFSHKSFRKVGTWSAIDPCDIVISGIHTEDKRTLRLYPNCNEDLHITPSTFAKFMGIYLSEGDFKKNSGIVNITQKKESVCEQITEMLDELGLPYNIYGKQGAKKTFAVKDIRLNRYLEKFGNCYTKYVPSEIKNLSRDTLRIFYDWFVLGDGRTRGDKRPNARKRTLTDDVFSTSKKMILDLNEIQLKIGYNGTYHTEKRDNDRIIEGRTIKGENSQPLHFSFRSLSENVWLDKRFINVSEEDYNGEVMCIEVEDNHNWFVMSNGFTHWTGNCNHPDSSTIDVSRIAMNIIELHWEGHTLVGKMEIPISEGFRNLGIVSTCADTVAQWLISGLKIGVSSRGLGSVKQQYGKLVVDDNYSIVCWDVVSQPSTPNAWIGEESELRNYIESDETNKNKPLIREEEKSKLSKFTKWLND